MSGLTALAAAPAVYLLYLIYKLDKVEKEPMGFLVRLVIFGALTTIPACIFEIIGEGFVEDFFGFDNVFAIIFYNIVIIAGAEELVKFLVLVICTWNRPSFNCRFDAVVYAVFVSLGFALLENILYVVQYGVVTGIIRALTAVPLHCAAGIYMGAYYGNAKKNANLGNTKKRSRAMLLSYLVPVLLHGVYDAICSLDYDFMGIVFLAFAAVMYVVTIKKVRRCSAEDEFIGMNADAVMPFGPQGTAAQYIPPNYGYAPKAAAAPPPMYGGFQQRPVYNYGVNPTFMPVIDANSVISRAKTQLFKTGIYIENAHSAIIGEMFSISAVYDSKPKIEILNDCARLFVCERGRCIYEYRTNSEDDVVFYIIKHVLDTLCLNFVRAKYRSQSTPMQYNPGFSNEIMQLESVSFSRIGGYYDYWYKCGRDIMRMQINSERGVYI